MAMPADPSPTPLDELPDIFDPIEFVAWITGNVIFQRNGDSKFSLTIPFQWKSAVKDLVEYNAAAIPLRIRIERYEGPDAS